MNRSLTCFFSIALLNFVGCAGIMDRQPEKPPLAESEKSATDQYILQLDDEIFDGKRLYVSLKVKDKDGVNHEQEVNTPVVARIRSMANGSAVGESFLVVTPAQLNTKLQMSVEATGFTDYQADLLWGLEARNFLKVLPPSNFIVVNDVVLVTQGENSTVQGLLQNKGVSPISNIPLSLELQWVKKGDYLDISKRDADATTDVDVTDVTVAPGESRPFSIALGSALAAPDARHGGEEGSWQPIVRVR